MMQSEDRNVVGGWEVGSDEDPAIVRRMQRLVLASSSCSGLSDIHVVHIDNWFGDRWLGFFGKKLGAFGYAANMAADESVCSIPPFHPRRVLSEARFRYAGEGILEGPIEPELVLHGLRTSEQNAHLRFSEVCKPGVYAWYSGKTKTNGRASLMVYVNQQEGTSGWYAEYQRTTEWRIVKRIGIGETEWGQLCAEAE